jgi:hypothetical protein
LGSATGLGTNLGTDAVGRGVFGVAVALAGGLLDEPHATAIAQLSSPTKVFSFFISSSNRERLVGSLDDRHNSGIG